jgi:protoheme IX farnesyltransferase
MGTPWAQILKQFETAGAGTVDVRDRADALRRFACSAGHYLALTKPRLLPMVLFTALPALVMASGGWPAADVILITLLGTALAAASANALNCYAERDRDALMTRTRNRPLPAGRIEPGSALAFGVLLAITSTILLWNASTPLAAGVALAAILFYVFVYTIWLKPRTARSVGRERCSS